MKNKRGLALLGGAIVLAIMLVSAYYVDNTLIHPKSSASPKKPAIRAVYPSNASNPSNASARPTITLEQYLMQNDMVKELPDDAIIWLRFYNFNTGRRQWENAYVIRRNSVVKGTVVSPDIEIWMASKYIPELSSKSLCDVIAIAKANNDFAAFTTASQTALMWKFRSMVKYKDCFGF